MKKAFYFLALAGVLTACSKLKITFRFTAKNDINLPAAPGSTNTANISIDTTINYTTPDITNTIPAEFDKNGADIDKVKELSIEGMDLSIKAPAGQTFDFLESISIYMGAPGKTEKLIASKTGINSISPAPTSISLTAPNADLIPFVKEPTYYLRVQAHVIKTYTQAITVGSEIKFKAVATPLK